jgi:hypothetical protein
MGTELVPETLYSNELTRLPEKTILNHVAAKVLKLITPNVLNVYFNIIPPSSLRRAKWPLPFGLQFSLKFLDFPMRGTYFLHLLLLDFITLNTRDELQITNSSLCSFLRPPATSSLFGSNIPLNSLLLNFFFPSGSGTVQNS